MKKLVICLLIATLLFSFTVITAAADEIDVEPTTATEPDDSSVVVMPENGELPEGYELDPDFSMTVTLDADNDWTVVLKDLLDDVAGDDDYIYFVVEDDVTRGYTPYYAPNNSTVFSKSSPGVKAGNLIVVKNLNEDEPPLYELPESGGIGTIPFTFAGTAILVIAAVYGLILYRKRKN